jgi:hypothetical protein
VDEGALGDHRLYDRLDRLLPHIGEHAHDDLPAAPDQAEDRWPVTVLHGSVARTHGALPSSEVMYRPRLVGHRFRAYAAVAAVESCSWRTALGGLNPCRSMSQVEL